MFRAKRSILDPFRAIFDDLGPNRHCGPDLDLQDQAGDGPLEWVRPVPKAPERSWHASGPSFKPNGRFWTHFGPFLMFLARLENQVWAKTWPETSNQASRFRNFFLGPIPELFSASCSSHFQEIGKIMSTQLTRHCFLHFQEMLEIMSAQTQTWHSWRRRISWVDIIFGISWKCDEKRTEKSSGMGPRKKFRNLQAWLGVPGQVLAQT